jgi:ribonuclease G
MAKELVISVNGREKKIAVIEDGRTTEFYIERGEENSGVVGNIYKGRVQRVLPGMQSAFVEIGLERDGFLYVSDFFDEEEELERIIQENSKKSVSPEIVEREAVEQIRKQRFQREHQIEEIQELIEPIAEDLSDTDEISLITEEPARNEEGSRNNKNNRNRRGGKREREEARLTQQPSGIAAEQATEIVAENEQKPVEVEQIAQEVQPPQKRNDRNRNDRQNRDKQRRPAFVSDEPNPFERIADDDADKPSEIKPIVVEQVRAIKFEMESSAAVEVGSIIAAAESETTFERIADEDEPAVVKHNNKPKFQPSHKKNRGGKKPQAKVEPVVKEEVKVAEAKAEPQPNQNKQRPNKPKKETPKVTVEVNLEARSETPKANPPKAKNQNKPNAKGKKSGNLKNAEAKVTESTPKDEMAVRRGGRGGRGPSRSANPNAPYKKEERFENSEMSEHAYSENEVVGSGAPSRSGNGRRNQPTISELLREGQEVLVQIAKEPIARKGARITSHISLPGRYLVYMPTVDHTGVSRKIEFGTERNRLRTLIQKIRSEEDVPSGGFIVRTAGIGVTEQSLRDDARYLVRTWVDIKKSAEKAKSPALVHQDLDIIQRILRDQLSEDFTAIRVDSEEEYQRIVEFVHRIQPRMVSRVKLYTRDEPILETFGVQDEINKAIKPRVWLKSGGYLVINQTEALVAIDVNTGKFVGRGANRLEDTITKTNMEAVEEVSRQIRLRDLGGIIVLDLIDMEDRRNRAKVMQALNEHLEGDKSPTKVLPFNDFGLVIMTRKRVKQSLERTMCTPCENCQGAGWVKSAQTVCFEILEESRRLSKGVDDVKHTTLRVNPEVAKSLRGDEKVVLEEIEAYLGNVDVVSDATAHQEQFDFAFI